MDRSDQTRLYDRGARLSKVLILNTPLPGFETSGKLYYGWKIALTLAFTEMTSWGILYYGFAVMLKPMQAETHWDRGTITGAFSLALLVSGIASVPVGRWLDLYGARVIMTIGSCAGVLLVLAWSNVQTIPGFYLVWLGIGLTMATVLYEPAFTVIANWFVRKRTQALTILTIGGGFASVIYVPLSESLARQHGWRPALVILAAMLAIITIAPHALVLRRRPADIGSVPDGEAASTRVSVAASDAQMGSVTMRVALRQAAFWWLSLAFTFTLFTGIAITVHLIPYLTERGFSSEFAAAAVGLTGGSQIPGRLLFSWFGRRMPRRMLTILLFGTQVVGLLILIFSPTTGGVIAFAVIYGAGAGASSPARAALVADLYGATHYGSINGAQTLVMTIARASAPITTAALYQAASSYQPVLWLLVVFCVGAVVALLLVEREKISMEDR